MKGIINSLISEYLHMNRYVQTQHQKIDYDMISSLKCNFFFQSHTQKYTLFWTQMPYFKARDARLGPFYTSCHDYWQLQQECSPAGTDQKRQSEILMSTYCFTIYKK